MLDIWTRLVCCVQEERGEASLLEVVCDPSSIMSSSESLFPSVRVYMTEKEALWHEFEHGFSPQGSISEGNPFVDIPSARVFSQYGAGPSGRVTEEVDSDVDDEVDSEETQVLVTAAATDAEPDLELHPGEGMLIKNPRSGVVPEDVRLWRYMYRIPLSVEI